MADRVSITAPVREKLDRWALKKFDYIDGNILNITLGAKTFLGSDEREFTVFVTLHAYVGQITYDAAGQPTMGTVSVASTGVAGRIDAAFCAAGGGFSNRETAVLAQLVTEGIIPA